MLGLLAKRHGTVMSNSTSISSDLINRRLSGAGQKTFYEPDAELAAVEDDQSEGLGLSAGFFVKMVVLFVAVGGGTYFFDAFESRRQTFIGP